MRNGVAHSGVQLFRAILARAAVLTVLPIALVATATVSAGADTLAVAEADARLPSGIFGPVGIIVVAVGVVGVVAGLLRRRRIAAARAVATQAPSVLPEPARSTTLS